MVRAGDRAPASALTLRIDPLFPLPRTIVKAVSVLREGGLVAFPTDTLYALGADISDRSALRRVFVAKGRREGNPVPLLVADVAMASRLVGKLPEPAARLAERYWPGPLTLLLTAPRGMSRLLTADTGRIGLRVPDAPIAIALITHLGGPLTGTSANRSGADGPRDAEEVLRQLGDRVDLILDGGPVRIGIPSTIVDMSISPPVIVREGTIRGDEIIGVLEGGERKRRVRRGMPEP